MNYSINVSVNGQFYFEMNRLSDKADQNITEFVAKLRKDYPASDGYKVTVSKVSHTRQTLDI